MNLDIYRKEQVFDPNFESFCDRNCVMQILSSYGIENPLFYINAAMFFNIYVDEKNPLGYNVKFDTDCLMPKYMSSMIKSPDEDKKAQDIWTLNKQQLKEGYPVITGVDLFYLDTSYNYKTYHSNHKCILCGYTDDEKYATIIDWYQWNFKGNIPLDQFLKARNSLCPRDESPFSGTPIKNSWAIIKHSDWQLDVIANIKETISRTITQFYENSNMNTENNFYGIEAMRKMQDFMIEHRDGEKLEMKEILSVNRIIFLLLYASVRLFSHYLSESSDYVCDSQFTELVQRMQCNVEQWRKAVTVMLKATISPTINNYDKVLKRISSLIEIEDQCYDLLDKVNKIL